MKLPSSYLAKSLLSMSVLAAIAFPSFAQANYIYTYTGNPFQATYTEYVDRGDGTYITVDTPFQTSINAEIRTKELLTAGSGNDDVTSIRYFADFLDGTLEINYPYSATPPEYFPTAGGYLNIRSVDENGLPTIYDSRFGEYVYLGGRPLKKYNHLQLSR